MPAITVPAPAKLNLHLEILGRRPDGFHELETIFQTIALADQVTVTVGAGSGITLRCDDRTLPTDRGNLAWRAAEAFCGGIPGDQAVDIHLAKRIPHGAGLGGGSSDAAAVLIALDRLLPGRHDAPALATLAAGLGSDVPFFLVGGTALGHGRGERLTPLASLPRLPVTVLMPDAQVSTPAAYGALTEAERGPRAGHDAAWWNDRLRRAGVAAVLHNRLAAPAVRLCPAVGDLLAWLAAQEAPHLMSGSGAACFALAHLDPPAATRAWQTWFIPGAGADG